jgi:hypothetical protein
LTKEGRRVFLDDVSLDQPLAPLFVHTVGEVEAGKYAGELTEKLRLVRDEFSVIRSVLLVSLSLSYPHFRTTSVASRLALRMIDPFVAR